MVNYIYRATPDMFGGLSTDAKPTTDVPNGSTFYEIDTSDLYMYDLENGTWVKQATLSDAETLNLLIEEDMLPAVRNADGAILTDQNGNIVLRY